MLEPVNEYFVKDGAVLHNSDFNPAWSKKRKTVYEVLRVINGIPLFEKEHIGRLEQSAVKEGIREKTDTEKVRLNIEKLIRANTLENGNILLCLIPNKERMHILSWCVKHHYPSDEDYRSGVLVQTMRGVRKQPNAKIWNSDLRYKADKLILNTEAYEVLLVDKKKNITEGSRSNIFFIRRNTVFTPPENKVLKGVTRQKVMEICEKKLIRVTETDILLREIPFYEAAFITGTSPGILPVNAIENHRFNVSNEIMKKLMAAYNTLVVEAAISIR